MTTMKFVLLAIFATTFTAYVSVSAFATTNAVKHIDLPDITSYEEAKEVFNQTTSELRKKNKLDETELQEVHIITYSLEKAVAYFSKNMEGDQQVSAKEIALKQVVNTNNCVLHLHKYEDQLLVTSAIDNLLKGASGQAIQNLNLIMGWEEDLGLKLKASIY